jgi:hypothetical protein
MVIIQVPPGVFHALWLFQNPAMAAAMTGRAVKFQRKWLGHFPLISL